jgi:hypothetical protein
MSYIRRTFFLIAGIALVSLAFTAPVFSGQIEAAFRNFPQTGKPIDEQKVKELLGMKETAGLSVRAIQKQSSQSLVGQWKTQFVIEGGGGGVAFDDRVAFLYPDGNYEILWPSKKIKYVGKWALVNNQLVLTEDKGPIKFDLLLTESFMILNLPGSDTVWFLQFQSNI